jgi:hypothetical protein
MFRSMLKCAEGKFTSRNVMIVQPIEFQQSMDLYVGYIDLHSTIVVQVHH